MSEAWLHSPYSILLFKRIGMDPTTRGVAGIAEDGADIVVWFEDLTEKRFEGAALS